MTCFVSFKENHSDENLIHKSDQLHLFFFLTDWITQIQYPVNIQNKVKVHIREMMTSSSTTKAAEAIAQSNSEALSKIHNFK